MQEIFKTEVMTSITIVREQLCFNHSDYLTVFDKSNDTARQ